MKRIAAIICLIAAMFFLAFATFSMGVRDGIRHAIEESKVYLNGTIVELRLDGKGYVHEVQ